MGVDEGGHGPRARMAVDLLSFMYKDIESVRLENKEQMNK